MLLKHFFTGKIAHSSYILAGNRNCAIIDPRRDIDIYIEEARMMGLRITHIFQTHLHADFVSGHVELAEKTGAKIHVAKSAACTFDHVGLSSGDSVKLEDMIIDVMETPGHTPEHLSFVVTDTSRSGSPVGVFVGDALFVNDVGRPDLFPDIAEQLAAQLFHSLHDKLLKLPDYVEVYPAHGAGSLCGRSLGAKYQTTIGYERRFNPALQISDKAAFVRSLTMGMPAAPDHFGRCSEINRNGSARFADLPVMERLSPRRFLQRMESPKILVMDVRGYQAFAGQHIGRAWHLDLNGNFPTFAGWVLEPDNDILVVADDDLKVAEAALWARRVGLDRITGRLEGGMTSWAASGLRTSRIELLSAEDLHEMIIRHSRFVLLDVRAPAEFEDNHIEGAVNIPVAELRTRHTELNPEEPVVLICSSGSRSSLGASILEQHDFKNLSNVAGGMIGYSAAGYTRECRACVSQFGTRFFDLPSGTGEP